MIKGKVHEFAPARDYPSWWLLRLQDGSVVSSSFVAYLVNNNWVNMNGELKPGEEVEFDIAVRTYSYSEYEFVRDLHRVPKETIVE